MAFVAVDGVVLVVEPFCFLIPKHSILPQKGSFGGSERLLSVLLSVSVSVLFLLFLSRFFLSVLLLLLFYYFPLFFFVLFVFELLLLLHALPLVSSLPSSPCCCCCCCHLCCCVCGFPFCHVRCVVCCCCHGSSWFVLLVFVLPGGEWNIEKRENVKRHFGQFFKQERNVYRKQKIFSRYGGERTWCKIALSDLGGLPKERAPKSMKRYRNSGCVLCLPTIRANIITD